MRNGTNGAAYFVDRFGRVPATFRMVERGQLGEGGSFTVPARWPQWFDKRWVPDGAQYRPDKRRGPSNPTPEGRERVAAAVERFKRGLTKNPEKIW
jgi:hypothetical protein